MQIIIAIANTGWPPTMCHARHTLGGRYHSAPSMKPRRKQSRQLHWLALGHLRKKPGWGGVQSCLILSPCFFCGSVFGLLNAVSMHEFINSLELLTQVWPLSPRSFLPHYNIKGKCTMLVIIITRQQLAEGWGWVFPFLYITSGLWVLCIIHDRRSINISWPVPMPC